MARDAIERWRHSGLSKQAFCRREGLARSSFDLWRRKIREDAARSGDSPLARQHLVEVVADVSDRSGREFGVVEVTLGSDLSVRLPSAWDAATIIRFIASLRRGIEAC